MGVYLKFRIKHRDREIRTIAIINSAYTKKGVRILLPIKVLEELGLSLSDFEPSDEPSEVAGGGVVYTLLCRKTVNVCIDYKDLEDYCAEAQPETIVGQVYVLISDELRRALGIGLHPTEEGKWFHVNDSIELKEKGRDGEKEPTIWE